MLTHQADKFQLPQDLVYLNCAYMSPLLKSVEEVGITSIQAKRNPTMISPEDFFGGSSSLRKTFASLINAPDHRSIAIIPSVSYGIATVANNLDLKHGENIVIAGEQFPSNVYSWKRLVDEAEGELRIVESPLGIANRGETWNRQIMDSIDDRTKSVAIAHVHWADGTLFDLAAIRKKSRDCGALLIIDGTQSVGALPFDVQELKPDALICAGYKWLLGPYSIGMAYYSDAFVNGTPLEENWINRADSEDFAGLVNYKAQYQPGMARYDVGERSNFILVPMLNESLRQIIEWQPARIQDYCKNIAQEALSKLDGSPFLLEGDDYRAHHLFGIRVSSKINVENLKNGLSTNKIYVSTRGNAIRISPHVYNDKQDLNTLVDKLLELA